MRAPEREPVEEETVDLRAQAQAAQDIINQRLAAKAERIQRGEVVSLTKNEQRRLKKIGMPVRSVRKSKKTRGC